MKVSVIVTVYNLGDFAAEALESALGQTTAPFEVVVVNDCSTDDSDAVLRSFGARIKYISLERNVGALKAALIGVDHAKGDILAFLDGDDIWEPTKIERCLQLFRADAQMMMVSHQHQRVDRTGAKLDVYDETHRNIDRIARAGGDAQAKSEAYKVAILEKKGYWLGSAYMFRRDALDLPSFSAWVDGLPKPEYVYLDLTVAPFLVLTNPQSRLGLVDERLFRYRIHGGNSCNDYRDVERALRSVHRGYYTTLAVHALLLRHLDLQMARRGLAAHQLALRYYEFLEALYLDRRMAAAWRFGALTADHYFSARGLAKEAVRLGLVLVGGPRLFLRAKNARAQS